MKQACKMWSKTKSSPKTLNSTCVFFSNGRITIMFCKWQLQESQHLRTALESGQFLDCQRRVTPVRTDYYPRAWFITSVGFYRGHCRHRFYVDLVHHLNTVDEHTDHIKIHSFIRYLLCWACFIYTFIFYYRFWFDAYESCGSFHAAVVYFFVRSSTLHFRTIFVLMSMVSCPVVANIYN